MRIRWTAAALVGLVAALPASAMAQDSPQPGGAGGMPAQDQAASPVGQGFRAAPRIDQTQLPSNQPPTAESPPSTIPSATAFEGQILLQEHDSLLATDFVGIPVANTAGETLGEVEDLIVGFDAAVDGVVIAVDRLIGFSRKTIAVAPNQLTLVMAENGQPNLIWDVPPDLLDQAPAFVPQAAGNPEAAPAEGGTGAQ